MMNRKRVFLALALGLLLALLCVSALAADNSLKISMEMSTNRLSEPKEITVSITLTNVMDVDMPGPVTLYYPSGKQVEEFGAPTLTVGASRNWSGTWKVTQKELEAGELAFKVKYSTYNENQEVVNITKTFRKKLIYTNGDPTITVTRTIMPTTAQKGQEVVVTYEAENTGEVDVTALTIKENSGISSKSEVIESLPAGAKEKISFTTTMGTKDLTSAPVITYKAGKKTYTLKPALETATVKYGQVKLSATLTADKKGGAPGDTVKLTLKLKNSGTVDFTDVTVTDETLGTVFSGLKVPKGETVTQEKDLTITENQDLQFRVTAVNETGEPVDTATGKVSIVATDPTQQIILSVQAEADREVVHKIPGTVRFTISVHNESAVDVKNIYLRAVDVLLYTFENIPAGETRSITRDMDVSMAGSYQFTASCTDQLDQVVRFGSNILKIGYAQPTEVPTEAPVVTPPRPNMKEIPTDLNEPEWLDQVETVADTARWVFGGIAAFLLLLLFIGAARRSKRRSESKKAMDHLEGANYRDYSTAPRRGKRSVITGNERNEQTPSETEQPEGTAQDSELMAETLKRLYTEPAEGTAQPEATPEKPAEQAETPAAAEAGDTAPQQETAEPAVNASEAAHRRRGRK